MSVHSIDTTGWSDRQKLFIKAAVSALLFDNTITHNGITVLLPNITIDSPSSDASSVVSESNILAKLSYLDSERAAADALVQAELAKRNNELTSSYLKGIKIDDVESYIDAIANLADAKIFLKKLCRFLIAKGVNE